VVPQLETEDVTLHVEVDGQGDPVTVVAHGLTNSCGELAVFTPMVPGTTVRFCFRGHGHSSVPERGYRFSDFARDLDAVACAYGATRAVGTSLGAGAIMHLLADDPERFQRIVFLLPAGLDTGVRHPERYLALADTLETLPREQAIEAILSEPARAAQYARMPWLRDLDLALWSDLNPEGAARAIREIVFDRALEDPAALSSVRAPALLICRKGDDIHPVEAGTALAEVLPNSELLVFVDESEMLTAVPSLVDRVARFLAEPAHPIDEARQGSG
jgi:3-oxoadipate enol-lactonase